MDAMPTAKLPVFSTLVSSWGSVPRNLGLAFRLYWPWAAVCTVAGAAWGIGIVANSGFEAPSATIVGGAGWLPIMVMLIALFVGVPAVFVGWHRGIETGERPSHRARATRSTAWRRRS